MDKRRGSSLSRKMILTTTLLILGIVALFGAIEAWQMSKNFDERAQQLATVQMDGLKHRGEAQTRDLVQAARSALLNTDYTTLRTFIPSVASKDDDTFAWTFVADKEGTVLAHTDEAANGKPVGDDIGKDLVAAVQPAGKEFAARRILGFSRAVEQEGQRLGTVVLALSLAPIDKQLGVIDTEKVRQTRETRLYTILVGLIFILVGSAAAVLQGMRISQPIQRLAASAEQIARGDLSTRAHVGSNDEIGRLGESFNFMADQLNILLRETAEKAVLEKELEVARTIQETLVPPTDLVDRGALKISGYFNPSSQCGGDWWTVNDLPGGKLLVVIGDVTGHGTPAAMITACAKAACDTIRNVAGDKLTVSQLLELMNHAIFESAKRRFVMTCFASIIDPKAHTITFANAGHNFPYLFRAKNGAATEGDELQVLMSRGNPLGDVKDSTYAEKTQGIEPNDILVWYTDGIVECENDRGEEFGEKRFRAAIKAAASKEPEAMRDTVIQQAAAFFGETPMKDDVTLVFGKVYA